jgi:hypothetical protein
MAATGGRPRGTVTAPPSPEAPQPEAGEPAARKATVGAPQFRRAARGYAYEALGALAELMRSANSEAVRVSAANALIDRVYGRPPAAAKAGDGPKGSDDVGPPRRVTFQWLDRETS